MFLNVVSRIAVVIALIGVGFVLDRRRVVSREALQSLGTIVINVMMPALIFSAMITQMSRESIMTGWPLPLLGALTFAIGVATGIMKRKSRYPEGDHMGPHVPSVSKKGHGPKDKTSDNLNDHHNEG